MTIDERVEALTDNPWLTGNAELTTRRRAEIIREALLEVARDQRRICAEAAMAIFSEFPTVGDGQYADSGRIHQAVMNAEIR